MTGSAGAPFRSIDPATGQVHEELPFATSEEVAAALDAADAAYRSWREVDLAERCALLARCGEIFTERTDELAAVVTEEMGKPQREAAGELALVSAIFAHYAEQAPAMLADEEISPASGGRAVVQKRPVGVVLGIMPWNFPHYQIARLVAPSLALGNTVLLKPAPSCPRSARLFAEVLQQAGVPEGVYQNLLLGTDQVEGVIADPRVQGVSLTGSERAGAAVAEIAGRHLKKVVLELGGSDPFVVLDTEDVARTAKMAFGARTMNMGQACNAPKRMIVPESIHDDFVAALLDVAADRGTAAPLSSAEAADEVARQIRVAGEQGAIVHVGGERSEQGAFVTPAVITGVTPQMDIYREEVFGPAAVVYQVPDEAAAVELANDTPFGLGAAVFSGDPDRARAVAEQIDAGMVFVNQPEGSQADLPFGGIKRSGFGRELGRLGITEFANQRLIRMP